MIHRLLGEWEISHGEVIAHTVCGKRMEFVSPAVAIRHVSRWALPVDCPSCREAE